MITSRRSVQFDGLGRVVRGCGVQRIVRQADAAADAARFNRRKVDGDVAAIVGFQCRVGRAARQLRAAR